MIKWVEVFRAVDGGEVKMDVEELMEIYFCAKKKSLKGILFQIGLKSLKW